MQPARLDKTIADNTTHSRSEAKELIRTGRVLINGQRARGGDQKIGEGDTVTVDGHALCRKAHRYLMLNKPAGVICSTRDEDHATVLDLLPPELPTAGLFPAGRLDKDTEGFVLLTDDGAFAHRMLSPRRHVPKTYLARLEAPIDLAGAQAAFAGGIELGAGDRCSPALIQMVEEGAQPLVEVVIHEGMYHQVKRMFRQLSGTVIWLKRTRIGGLSLDPELPPGAFREILHKELEMIC